MSSQMTAEHRRLAEHAAHRANWRQWGAYLAERAWGTVREDYSERGSAWEYFPHDHARSRTYRWNEDGLGGISDRLQYLCLAMALWNGHDPILKERLFGLTGPEGNHGEDVKEDYYYLDALPTHSYLRMLYKYPQGAFPYQELSAVNRRRGRLDPEYELLDTGALDHHFDVGIEYAKAAPDDVLCRITATNRGPKQAACWILPTIWFRNTWSWGYSAGPMGDVPERPRLRRLDGNTIEAIHPVLGSYRMNTEGASYLLFTENESNNQRLWGVANASPFVKDGFHRYLIEGEAAAVNQNGFGTKAAAVYRIQMAPEESQTIRLRLSARAPANPFEDFDQVFTTRLTETNEFYRAIQAQGLDDEERSVQRQAYAGMIWGQQMYYYDVEQWLDGDPGTPEPPLLRKGGRNRDWGHLNNFDILSVCDTWEYPWFAVWDLAFHCIPLARLDPEFAKRQLELITREWYMHPNGQLPAYEWAFGDANPPVHAWAARRVYEIDAEQTGRKDTRFLEAIFHKLLLNFTWWVNRKDAQGNNVFQGGFLGLDNISVFDRSAMLPAGGQIDQSDGTAWMGFYTLEMLNIALKLATANPVYQDLATKFFEHFLSIASAMNAPGHRLWDEEDGFFYDVLRLPDGTSLALKLRSLVGLIPMIGSCILDAEILEALPDFNRRTHWFLKNRPQLTGTIANLDEMGVEHRHLVALLTHKRLVSLLGYLGDEREFLSTYGIRSLSKVHAQQPYRIEVGGRIFEVDYQPAESTTGLFGGNSNWRGPIWFPINFLIIESLKEFHRYFGDTLLVEFPVRSGHKLTLADVADDLSRRLVSLFLPGRDGLRPVFGDRSIYRDDASRRHLVLFHEYFHGEDGRGLGASHQTGWTGLVAELIHQLGNRRS